jgi:hypothetical protein
MGKSRWHRQVGALLRLQAPRSGAYLLVALLVLAVTNTVVIFGWGALDPTNDTWLKGDSETEQLGWEFLWREPRWYFPPTWVSALGYPIGDNVAYFDLRPLFAVWFRVFASVLPDHFQYFGFYLLLSSSSRPTLGIRYSQNYSRTTPGSLLLARSL